MRKTVTVLFCDLVGSTPFGERVDTESVRETLGRYHSMVQRAVDDRGGTVAKFIGDGVMAVFGVPEVAEDDAERAVAAGLELQRGFDAIESVVNARFGVGLGLRVGVNSGEVIISDDDSDLVGDVLNTAARLEAACESGQVLVGEDTWRLTRSNIRYESLGEIELRGKSEGVAAFRAIDEAGADDDAMTPFVGRDEELQRLLEVIDDAVSERAVRLATVIGAPGVGKTRLADELERAFAGDATFVDIRIERAGGTTFAPIAELLRIAASLDDAHTSDEVLARIRGLVDDLDDADRVASLLASFVGAAEPRSTEELFFAVRRLLEAVSRTRSIVIVVDDIQWAEPLLLDLLEHLAEWVHDAPAVVLALARPELREIRPALAEKGRRVAEAISLEGLDPEATAELAARLVGAAALPGELLARLPESTEGNPLFVRELMKMLVDDKVIVEGEQGWELAIDADAIEVPPTIQSLLSSRIERLPGPERRLLERASVVGADFPLGAVAELTPQGDAGRLIPILERLRRKELVEPTGAYWGNEPIFRFHHALIRDAAYRRLLKRTRSDHHLTVAAWMESSGTAVTGEHDTAIGYHLEQAHDLRVQLNLADDETAEVGARAAETLGAAAQRALGRDDVAAASSLAARAVELLDQESADLPDLLILGCEAFLTLGDVGAALPLLKQLEARVNGDERLAAWVAALHAQLLVLTEPDRLVEAEAAAASAADLLADLDDRTGEANARLVRAGALARLGHIGECEAELDKALTAARAADDGRRVATVLGAAPVAALWGPSPVPRAGGRCLDVLRLLRITTGSPRVEAISTRCQAVLEALRGRFDTSRNMLADTRSAVEELGDRHGLLETQLYWGFVELLADDPEAAEPHLRAAYGGLGRLGIGADAGQAAAYLSRSLLLQGRLDEAAELAADSEALAGQNPQTAIAAKTARAELLAAQGQLDEALRVAEKAVAAAEGTDILIDHANANLALARVRSLAGDAEGTRDALTSAERLFTAKGASVNVDVEIPDQPQVDPATSATSTASAAHMPVDADEEMWSRADELTRAHLTAAVQGDWVVARESLADEVVLDDRRPMVSSAHRGVDEVVAYWQAAAAVPVARQQRGEFATVFEPVACRGENLVLHRCTVGSASPNAATQLHWLRLTEVDDGLITRITNFEPDDLTSAIEEIERRYDATETDLDLLHISRLTGIFYAVLTAGDIDCALAWLHPDTEIHDHRPVGWGSVDGRQLRERFETLADLGGAVTAHAARYRATEGPVSWFDARVETMDEHGARHIDRQVLVSRDDPDTGLPRWMHQYGDDDLAEARRQYEGMIADSVRRGDLYNTAASCGGFAHTWARDERWDFVDAVVSPDLVVVRPDGSSPADLERSLAEQARELGLGATTRQVLAVRGKRRALAYLVFDDHGEGRHLLTVEEVDTSSRLTRIIQFDTASLAKAIRELDRRSIATEPPEHAEVLELGSQFGLATSTNDVDWTRAHLTEDFVVSDHRELGFGAGDRDHLIEVNASRVSVGAVVFGPRVISLNRRGSLSSLDSWRTTDSGALEPSSPPGFGVIQMTAGLISAVEIFPVHALEQATAGFEELTREPDGSSHEPWNCADAVGRRIVTAWVDGTILDLADAFSPDVELASRRFGAISPPEGRHGREEVMTELSTMPYFEAQATATIETIATRGGRLALVAVQVCADASPQSSAVELLILFRTDDEECCDLARSYGPDQRDRALADLDALYLDSRPDLAECFFLRSWTHGFALASTRGPEHFVRYHDPRAQLTDRRPIGVGGQDHEAGSDRSESVRELPGPRRFELARLVRCEGPIALVDVVQRFTQPSGAEYPDRHYLLNELDADSGLAIREEEFSEDALDEAVARWDELTAEHGHRHELSNTASLLSNRFHSWVRAGDWDLIEPNLAEQVEITGTAGLSPDIRHQALTTLESARDIGFSAESRRVLAVRGEHLALMEWADGTSRQFAVIELDARAALRMVRLYPWDVESLTDAADYLEARWKETTDLTSVELVLVDAIAGWRHGDQALLARCLHDDFMAKDHRPLSWGDYDKTEFIALFDPDQRNVVVEIAGHYFGNTSSGRAFQFTAWGFADDELIEALPGDFVAVVRDGLVLRTDGYEVSPPEETLARLSELEAELGAPTAESPGSVPDEQ